MSSKMSPERFERASVLCDLARALVEANGNPDSGHHPANARSRRKDSQSRIATTCPLANSTTII
jgi:hypothetical protein